VLGDRFCLVVPKEAELEPVRLVGFAVDFARLVEINARGLTFED
jgi:hypothetical protein